MAKREDIIQEILQMDDADQRYISDVVNANLGAFDDAKLTPEDEAELVRRAESFKTHPESFQTWEEVKAMLQQQRLQGRQA